MAGENDLGTLLADLSPRLGKGEYVFHSFPNGRYGMHPELEPIAAIAEAEGLTLVVPRERADAAGLPYESVFGKITLGVHSSLDAVGLTAAVSARLAEHGLAANVVAGYFHDHVFVSVADGQRALDALTAVEEREDSHHGRVASSPKAGRLDRG